MDYSSIIQEAGKQYNVDPALLTAVMGQESAGNAGAVSPKGASGLMQLMPATAQSLGVTDINDPVQNIHAGARYLGQQLDKYGTVPLALAAYNAGPGAVDKHGGIPPFPETQDYVKKITANYQPQGKPMANSVDPFTDLVMGNGQPAPVEASATASAVDPFAGLMLPKDKPKFEYIDDSNNPNAAPGPGTRIEINGVSKVPEAANTVDPFAGLMLPKSTEQTAATPTAMPAKTNQFQDFVSATGHHLMNMPHGLAQLVENGVGYGAGLFPANPVSNYIQGVVANDNQAMADRERLYQQNTPDSAGAYAGATVGEVAPFLYSAVGNSIKAVGNTAAGLAARVLPESSTKLPMIFGGAAQGGVSALAQPVTSGDYLDTKAKQLLVGSGFGAAAPPIIKGLSSVISPSPSSAYNALNSSGVNTTIGQRLGGIFNSIEEKSQSIPVIGDFISQARNRALQSYNKATLNQVVNPIGETISAVGHDGVAEAGDKLSNAYNTVLGNIKGVTFDGEFQQSLGQLRQLATGLTPDMASRFNSVLENNFTSRLSPVGGLDAHALKTVASDIGSMARRYSGSSIASEQELGSTLTQFGALINNQIGRANPTLAPTLNAIDTGWAKLVRVEGAAKAAASNKSNTGVFTPGQLMSSVRQADQSVRDRATARGEALMQDWAQAGLKVLGDKVPNSGTFDRTANGGLLVGLASNPQFIAPAIGAAVAGGGIYSPLGQQLLKGAATARPSQAKALSGLLNGFIPAVP